MVKKKIVTVALTAALLMTTHAVPVSAAENVSNTLPAVSAQIIAPRWESTKTVLPSITVSGKQISVSVYISPINSMTTSIGTLYLEKKSGNGWMPVTSWSIDVIGKVDITKTYRGTTGVTYRTRVVAITGVDKIDVASNERTI